MLHSLYLVPFFIFVSVILSAVVFCNTATLLGKSLNSSLVESAILVSINSLKTGKNYPSQRRLSDADTAVIENAIYEEAIDIPQESQAFKLSMMDTFGNIPDDQSIEAFAHAVDYLSDKKIDFSLSNDQFLSGLTSIISAYSESFPNEEEISKIPEIVFNVIIPDKIINWGGGALSWGTKLSQAIISTIPYSDDIPATTQVELLTGTIIKSIMAFYESNNPNFPSVGIYPGIDSIVGYDESNDVMKFDGKDGFMKFDPSKTEIINSVSYGISSALFSSSLINEDTLSDFASSIARPIIDEALSFIHQVETQNPDQSHSFFVNEITKVISHGVLLGAVSTLARDEESNALELPGNAAKLLSEDLAYSAINKTLELGKTNWELERIAESSAFGSATGSQLAAVFDKSMDYTESWESYERKQLAKLTSEGSALGSTSARIVKVRNDFSEATNEDDSLNIADTARNELLAISQHSAMGSLIGNVGMSLYYPNPMDKLALINFAAQGATTGSISGTSELDLKRPTSTETFDVEIARSSSQGASFGAVFETVALTEANPKDFSNDISVTSVVQAVTYGATYGAISAGDQNDAPVADALVFKQATKQGAIEGSLSGASLGSGISAENENDTDLRAKSSIIKAVSETNAQAAANASSSMATKAIRTSTSDMLMLMKKFGINPRLTNPTKIFKKKTTKNEEDDFLFKEELKVATPI